MEQKNKLMTNSLFVALAAMFCCALWGSATPFIKTGYKLMLPENDVASTILFAGVRFVISLICVTASRHREQNYANNSYNKQ